MARGFIVLGAVSGGLAVVLGAFGAHALRGRLTPDMLAVFEVGVRYQMYHALALILIGVLATTPADGSDGLLQAAGAAMAAGTVLFSGSLYALALTDMRALGMVTPVGGLGFIVGWALLAAAALRR